MCKKCDEREQPPQRKCVNCRNVVYLMHFAGDSKKCMLCAKGGVSHKDLKDLYYMAISSIDEMRCMNADLAAVSIIYQDAAELSNKENDRLREEIDELKELRKEFDEMRKRVEARTAANKAKKQKQRQAAKLRKLDDLPPPPYNE